MYISSRTVIFCLGEMCKIARFQRVVKVKVTITYMHTLLELEETLTCLLESFHKGHFSPKGSQTNPISSTVSCFGIIFSKRPLLGSGYRIQTSALFHPEILNEFKLFWGCKDFPS